MKMSIARLLTLFAVVVGLGMVAAFALQTYARKKLEVNGPIYSQVVGGKDLIADILPPPMFLVESYLLANEARLHPGVAEGNLEKIVALKAEYDARRAYWKDFPLPEDQRLLLENEVLPRADIVWQTIETRFEPALRSGDTQALDAVMRDLLAQFRAHREAVVQLVDKANAFLADTERSAREASVLMGQASLFGGIASILVFFAGTVFFSRRAIAPLGRMADFMKTMAAGDYSQEAPHAERHDEIGQMARSIAIFRQAGLDKIRLEEETRAAQDWTEQERAARLAEREREAAELARVVEDLGAGLSRLADCNIRITIDQPFAEQYEPLRRDFNDAIGTFQATLEMVLDKTRMINESGSEMRVATDNLAQRTEQQAAALEQASAALEQITATVRSSADKVRETRELVGEARRAAEASQGIVHDAVDGMHRIEDASRKISTIVSVIDEIAFQTNLLALNAGVEAARAGEAGRGFTVVAQEVRELAQRSAVAAQEIGGIIARSTQEVSEGVRLVGQTGEALGRISGFVGAIDSNVGDIATAAHEQTTGLEQINLSVGELDRMTQRNAAMVEEQTAMSHTLAENSTLLAQIVRRFKLNRRAAIREPGTPAAMAAPRRRAA
jgi:methyl-accepting chemotaxis protein